MGESSLVEFQQVPGGIGKNRQDHATKIRLCHLKSTTRTKQCLRALAVT